MARRIVFRSVLALLGGSLVAACYWISPYSDLTEADGVDAGGHLETDAAGGDASDADPDLLGYWTFEGDEGGIARDRSGQGNDLLLEKAVVSAPGYDGGVGLQYPDGGGVAHNDLLGSEFPPAGTLSMWAFFPPPATDVNRAIFDGYDATRRHLFVRYTAGRGDAAAAVQPLDFVSQIDTGFDFYAFAAVPVGRWTHLVMTWDRTTTKRASFYVDGASAAGGNFAPGDAAATAVTQYFDLSNGYGGSYDDIPLWKRAFSEEEVREIP